MDMTAAFIVGQSIHLAIFIAVVWIMWPWMPWKQQPQPDDIITREHVEQARFEMQLAKVTDPWIRNDYREALITAATLDLPAQTIKTMAYQHATKPNQTRPNTT